VAVALGALVLGETVTIQILVGGLVILVGVGLVISNERGKKASHSEVASHEMA
jgi:drug/metabolite transporter (DMT)-like permease